MTLVNINQLEQEQNLWKIKLEHFKQENVLLKYRLSEMVDNNEGSKFLQMAEYFQNQLLIADERLKKLFNKLEQFSNLFKNARNERELPDKIITNYNKFKKDIFQFEKKFLNLTKEFNEKMLENTKQ
ncbi:MAG TPA: hypothetical protein VFI29_21455 [Hanamia sp.]|nr:hypothetical protein [Hanamia sp.]